MPPPYVAKVRVREAANHPVRSPSQLNARLREVVAPQKAPEKPRQGDIPARPARMPMYSVLALRQWRAVMEYAQSGVIPKSQFALGISSPYGKGLSWDERANIVRDYPGSYGDQFGVAPQTPNEIELRTLLKV